MHGRFSAELAKHAGWKLRWNKYSKAYQRRLLEGVTTLNEFLHTAGVNVEV